jgi:hypothetical protein
MLNAALPPQAATAEHRSADLSESPISGVMPHQFELVMAAQVDAMIAAKVDVRGDLVSVLDPGIAHVGSVSTILRNRA